MFLFYSLIFYSLFAYIKRTMLQGTISLQQFQNIISINTLHVSTQTLCPYSATFWDILQSEIYK